MLSVSISTLRRKIDVACAAFFRGRLLLAVGKGVFVWLGLWLCGVEFSLTIGFLTGVEAGSNAQSQVTHRILDTASTPHAPGRRVEHSKKAVAGRVDFTAAVSGDQLPGHMEEGRQ